MKKNIFSKNDLLIISLIIKNCGNFKLKTFINDEMFLEKGMFVRVTDVFCDGCFLVLSLDLSLFFEHNSTLMAECYPPNDITKSNGLFKILYTALESGNYSDNIDIYFDTSDYSCPDEVLSYISEYITPLNLT